MYYVAQTEVLVADGVIDRDQAREIEHRARAAMVTLGVNSLLIAGIVAATLGLVFYLDDAASVAIFGALFLAAGVLVLIRGGALYHMFGNASALIGAGMLVSGSGIELVDKYADAATPLMLVMGGALAVIAGGWRIRSAETMRFALGATGLMGAALHVAGVYFGAFHFDLVGWPMPLLHLYVAAIAIACGLFLDLRVVTALAIIPLAQVLDTGSGYFHAVYVFYSPESTLSILQMSVVIACCLWAASHWGDRVKRQAGTLAVLAFVVVNLCFLVGSLSGDVVGESIWGPQWSYYGSEVDFDTFLAARDAFRETAITISEDIYAIIWAVLLVALIAWAASTNRRGLFNVGMTFAAIHAYTQMFESFGDEPLAYVIGGLAAIPLSFGLWRLNERFKPAANEG
jgi:hypothetical protein